MKERDYMDIGKIMDEIFSAAEEFGQKFTDGMRFDRGQWHERGWHGWHEGRDFYPGYLYPPVNVFMHEDKSLGFEFALAGFREQDINLEFKGDYMVLSATAPDEFKNRESVRYFKRRLKLRDVESQKYFVPEDKYDQSASKAVFRNGILSVTVPARETVSEKEGFKVRIHPEGADDGNRA